MLKGLVDVHTHVYLQRYINLLTARESVPRIRNGRLLILPNEDAFVAQGRPIGAEYYDMKEKLKFMDSHGIQTSVISMANPWLDFLGSEATAMATLLNQDLALICKTTTRFKAFGVLPTEASACILELDRVKTLGLAGVILGTRGLGKGLDDPMMEPVFQKAEELGLMLFLHPHYGISTASYGSNDNGHVLPLALGFPFETSIVF
jgi:predicted TIM-barrel fold metal-dependent hydrolase